MDKVRIDKWLWSVRIFKSRSIATEACKSGKIKLLGNPTKPSVLIKVGDHLQVKKNGYNMLFQVDGLIEKRVSAKLAVDYYSDLTPEDELNKYESWYVGKAAPERRDKGAGRPSKKERRVLDTFKIDRFDPKQNES